MKCGRALARVVGPRPGDVGVPMSIQHAARCKRHATGGHGYLLAGKCLAAVTAYADVLFAAIFVRHDDVVGGIDQQDVLVAATAVGDIHGGAPRHSTIVGIDDDDRGVLRIAVHVRSVQPVIGTDRQLRINHVTVHRAARDADVAPARAAIAGGLEIHVGAGGVILSAALPRVGHAGRAGGVL